MREPVQVVVEPVGLAVDRTEGSLQLHIQISSVNLDNMNS